MFSVALLNFSTPNRFPLGIAALSSFLSESGYRSCLMDEDLAASSGINVASRCEGFDMVGIFFKGGDTATLGALLKSLGDRGHIIVVGGDYAALYPDKVLEMGADFVVDVEREETFIRLLQALEKNEDPLEIPGVMSLNSGDLAFSSPMENQEPPEPHTPPQGGVGVSSDVGVSFGNQIVLRGVIRLADGTLPSPIRNFPGYDRAPEFLRIYPDMEIEIKMGGQSFIQVAVVGHDLCMGSLIPLPSSMEVPEVADEIVFKKPGYRAVLARKVPIQNRFLDFSSVLLEPEEEGIGIHL